MFKVGDIVRAKTNNGYGITTGEQGWEGEVTSLDSKYGSFNAKTTKHNRVCHIGYEFTGLSPEGFVLVNHSFHVGDRVRFKSWEQMKKEFGLDRDGDIKLTPCFARHMKHLCGTYATITEIDGRNVTLKDFSADSNTGWSYSLDMLEPYSFSVEDIKVGHVLECQKEDETFFMMVLPNYEGSLCCSGPDHWFPLKEFDNDLCYGSKKVMKIYGLTNNHHAHMLNGEDRKIIWQRKEEKKEMTIAEIEKELGYQIKIVKED